MHNLGDAYGARPSKVLGLETPWGAYQFDEICLRVGRQVDRNINEGKDPFAGLGLIDSIKRGYRSARQFVRKKLRIPKSGIW